MFQDISIGIDAGSTTVKIVATDKENNIIFKDYRRHMADISGTVIRSLELLSSHLGDLECRLSVTGSAGMGISERCGIPFVQEVVAACEVIRSKFPTIKTLVDIGGEDAKMIFFRENLSPDIRMNGSCAGGTGAFIDQMAALLDVDLSRLNLLAQNAQNIYPIASRCGVFSKTDVQNLLSRNVCKEDIAASVFHAVSMQVITSLSRGCEVTPGLFLCGGPFMFIPALRQAFVRQAGLSEHQIILSENAGVIPAWGAAIDNRSEQKKTISAYIALIKNSKYSFIRKNALKPLFVDKDEFSAWEQSKQKYKLPDINIRNLETDTCFVGIDSGSTTTKIVATDYKGRIFYRFYERNKGNVLQTVSDGLNGLRQLADNNGKELKVMGGCVTGYGEDLVKTAFGLPYGMVETIAHYQAACFFNPKVSFILDIGGQDMKATFIENGSIKRLEINEACSSGCGSFIETFAQSLNYNAASFSEVALYAKHPADLGTRCTVFMNSKVKQSLREGASISDISAGLGYSVIKNCLVKVLKLKDVSQLGEYIMVQGGTFRNRAVLRALETETGREVMITDYPELMGAYGAALFAVENQLSGQNKPVDLAHFVTMKSFSSKVTVCKGCENLCTVTGYRFDDGNRYYTGNKCEKVFSNRGDNSRTGANIYTEKHKLLFDRKSEPDAKLTIGIPRALGIYENYPFWHTLFTECGFNVVLSDTSTMQLYERGIGTVMADNICFPAKLANGHILNLIDRKVDRIFMPFVVHDKKEDSKTPNSYNCPIVSGYSEVIQSAIDPDKNHNTPFDAPTFTFRNERLLSKACLKYLLTVEPGISGGLFKKAFAKALSAQADYENALNRRCKEILDQAVLSNRMVVLLAGRPYHSDPLIQHKISETIAAFDVDVISEDIVRDWQPDTTSVQTIMQWAYTNRILKSALWASQNTENIEFVELTSFGCGPDAFILDEVTDLLKRRGKNATLLKIDDINNVGSARLRIRSLIESLKFKREQNSKAELYKPLKTPAYEVKDRKRKLLIPWFADFYSPFIPPAFSLLGYDAENLPPSDESSVEYGLKYSNNEICYPATLIVGDFMKALESGQYNQDEIALGITQTGGQCRATSYISLMKKAMLSAGFDRIPVVSASYGDGTINEQPGFTIQWRKVIKAVICSMAYADCLSQLYYATAPREKVSGMANVLKDKYLRLGVEALLKNDINLFYKLIEQASAEFLLANNLAQIPQVGIVGEIFVKYNNFGHKNIVNWLIAQQVEPILPPLSNFFTAEFVSMVARQVGNITQRKNIGEKMVAKFAEKYIYDIIHKMQSRIQNFPYFRPVSNLYHDANNASKIINLNAQFGEGWGIAAEFAHFAATGVNNVVSLQPFGCIANHVISKGIEKRTRELFPALNLLFLDFDSGMAEANIFNRLHFMIRNAQAN
jgi:predicted CoA-substrate-specific enzyme activase